MDSEKTIKGGRNLAIMAVVSILISVVMTVISLAVYHYSGDIYLDRSRPGYLPDTEEVETIEEAEEGDYNFSRSGAINEDVLNEYLEKLEVEIKALNDYQDPFDDEALSDEHFGL